MALKQHFGVVFKGQTLNIYAAVFGMFFVLRPNELFAIYVA